MPQSPRFAVPVERGFYYSQIAVLAASLGRLPQCDGLFKACVQCVADCGEEEESRALELVRTVSSALVVAPGHPNAFYVVRGLVNAVERRPWTTGHAHMAVLALIEVLTRVRLPYRVVGADSNDVLYGDDAAAYSNDAISLANLQETKLNCFPDSTGHRTLLMNKIRSNVVKRSEQVSHSL